MEWVFGCNFYSERDKVKSLLVRSLTMLVIGGIS